MEKQDGLGIRLCSWKEINNKTNKKSKINTMLHKNKISPTLSPRSKRDIRCPSVRCLPETALFVKTNTGQQDQYRALSRPRYELPLSTAGAHDTVCCDSYGVEIRRTMGDTISQPAYTASCTLSCEPPNNQHKGESLASAISIVRQTHRPPAARIVICGTSVAYAAVPP